MTGPARLTNSSRGSCDKKIMPMNARTRAGFTLVELMVVIAIIGTMVAFLIPALSGARAASQASASMNNLAGFGRAFAIYANANDGRLSSGAFDHNRDGDVRKYGWVADVIRTKVGIPGQSLDPAHSSKLSITVGHYTDAVAAPAGARQAGVDAGRWTNLAAAVPATIYGTLQEKMDLWTEGHNTNYVSTWHFSRADPTHVDTFSPNQSGLKDGEGPLSEDILALRSRTTAARVALLGTGRPSTTVTAAHVTAMTAFLDRPVGRANDRFTDHMTAGMTVDVSGIAGLGVGNMIHDLSAISPFHQAKNGDGTGGFAPVLFADFHVDKVFDTINFDGTGRGDGYLGNGPSGTVTHIDAYKEVAEQMWVRRLMY